MPTRKKAAPQKTAKPQPIKPMAEKKESDTKETKENDVTKIRLVAPDFEHPPVKRSDTEQAIIDEYGTDASKFKEGTREHDLVSGLPENIEKKRKEDKEKAEKSKK